MIIKTLSKFIFLTGIRDKLFIGLLTIILVIFAVSNLIGFTALTEEAQMQLTYFAFLSRIVIICGMILFICAYKGIPVLSVLAGIMCHKASLLIYTAIEKEDA